VLFIDAEGRVAGDGRPSKELAMHRGVLAARPDVNVVCHVHGSFITAVTTLYDAGDDTLPPLCPGHVYYAWPLPMLPYHIPGAATLAEAVAKAYEDTNLLALLLKNHGLITVGTTLADAVNVAEEVDEAAMIWIHTQGRAKLLPVAEAEALRAERLAGSSTGA
jgi:ribulose-5-phosphate 4-epimerase/fuculose-1-phosphate aldolase